MVTAFLHSPPPPPAAADLWWSALQAASPCSASALAKRVGANPATILAWLEGLARHGRAFSFPPAEGEDERRWAWSVPADEMDAPAAGCSLFDDLE